MSTMALVQGPKGIFASWDTAGQIYLSRLSPEKAPNPIAAPGAGQNRKHPALAVHSNGDILLAWTEGTAWERGGSLVWQVFDSEGKAKGKLGRSDRGIPVWGLPAVASTAEGFLIFH